MVSQSAAFADPLIFASVIDTTVAYVRKAALPVLGLLFGPMK